MQAFYPSISLTPMAFDKYPTAVPISPVSGYPLRVRTRRYDVATRNPYITVTVPAMISTCPDISGMRGRSRMFNNDRGRSHANNNLREGWRRNKSTSDDSDKREFLHGYFVSSYEVTEQFNAP